MSKINLKSNEMSGRKPRSQGSNKSLVLGILTLIIGLAAFGVMRYLTVRIESQSEEISADIAQLEENMNTDSVRKIYDFQDRLIEIEELMGEKVMQSALLEKVEKHTLPQTTFIELETEQQVGKTEVNAIVLVGSHNELAKQIEAFSLIEEVEDVFLKASKVSKEGSGIEGELLFFINNKAK